MALYFGTVVYYTLYHNLATQISYNIFQNKRTEQEERTDYGSTDDVSLKVYGKPHYRGLGLMHVPFLYLNYYAVYTFKNSKNAYSCVGLQ